MSKTSRTASGPSINNKNVLNWVAEMMALCQPQNVHWCDGSAAEKAALTAEAVARGILVELDQKKLPGCYYHRSNANDVARVEQCTYICTPMQDEAGPTNNWMAPQAMYAKLRTLCDGAMKGRTMYVVPYLMGPLGSPLTKVGIELTDSIYVVLSMRIMTRMGEIAYRQLGDSGDFNRGLRSSPSAPTTAATCCSGRSASRCASGLISAATRAGWRNTC